jgi:RHS repeat-associated protein
VSRATGMKHACRYVVAGFVLFVMPAEALAQSTTQVVEYYHTDAQGSVRAVTKQVNGQWQVVARYDFMPFGEETAAQAPSPFNRLFTGKEKDQETGQDYFGARYYRAGIGRFTTVDPELRIKDALVDPQKWNRYAYVQNDPLRYVDPDGRYGIDVHYYLTFALAYAAGYRSDDSANRIARADLSVDLEHDPLRVSEAERGKWHFPDATRLAEVEGAFGRRQSNADLGTNLHVYQDSFSHAGFGAKTGHALSLEDPDNTSKHAATAMEMAKGSYEKLVANGGQSGRAIPWSAIEPYVKRYVEAGSQKEKDRAFYEFRQFVLRQ